ncbi:MAG TPA: S9 family peptidase [Candidatus Eremiobacteraceae bacterium]|jgi:dipeptidyl aminopeptidase/acylaminoacyl peptidase
MRPSISFAIAAVSAYASLFAFSTPAMAATRPVKAEDLFALHTVSSAIISHDGSRIAYVVTKMDGPKDTYLTDIWVADVSTGHAWQLTQGDSDADPAWSPDDKWLAFDSGRGDKGQVYRISLGGGEAQRLTDLPNGAFAPSYSHDGSRILFSSVTLDAKTPAHIDFKAAGFTPKDEQKTSDVRIITVRHFESNGQGDTYDRHVHLWVMSADGGGQRALTSGHEWSEQGAVWSPDDRQIAFGTLHGDDPYGVRNDIYVIPSSGGAARKIPLALVGNYQPTWSGDGKGIYYFKQVTHDPAGYASLDYTSLDATAQRELVPPDTLAWGDAVITDMTEGGAGCGPLLGPGDRWYLAIVSRPGASALVKYDARTGAATTIAGGDREVLECSMSDDGSKAAFVASDATHPSELYVVDTNAGAPKRLTNVNGAYLATVSLSTPQEFEIVDNAGYHVHYWVMRPPNAVAGRRYPTILDIHGGPQTEFGNAYFDEFQYLAGLGYNVVYADPRGSPGFGHAFEAALNLSWGDAMFDDEMRVMDAVAQRPDVDSGRLGVSGGSYGGYATLWVIEHTDRFKAAISERPAVNMTTQWLAGDVNFAFDPKYSWGNPWDHFSQNWRVSPSAYVDKIHTPLMLLHSDNDIRTPIGETLQVFSALKILGREVQYVEFPRDNHDLSRTGEPIHRVERLRIGADWFAKYLHP